MECKRKIFSIFHRILPCSHLQQASPYRPSYRYVVILHLYTQLHTNISHAHIPFLVLQSHPPSFSELIHTLLALHTLFLAIFLH